MNIITQKVENLLFEAAQLEEKGRTHLAQSFREKADSIRKRRSFQVPSDVEKGKWYTVSTDPVNRIFNPQDKTEKQRIIQLLNGLTKFERNKILRSFGLSHLVEA